DPSNPATFTLELVVDRIAGTGFASFSSGDFTESRNYKFAAFGSDFGPTITALQPTLAIAKGNDVTASLRVLEFQVFTNQIPEPSTWMLFGVGLLAFAGIRVGSAYRSQSNTTNRC